MSSQAGNVVTERGAKVERNGSKPEIGRIVFPFDQLTEAKRHV